jgi:predicted permease
MRNIFSSVLQDLAYAGRGFRRNPGFVAVAVASVALAVAANSTIFSVVNVTLFGALPVREPGRLVTFNEGGSDSFSYLDYLDYRGQTDVFEDVCAYYPLVPVSLGGAEPERIFGQLVSGNYFSVMGLRPFLGRSIRPDEDTVPGRDPVVVLAYSLWRRRFAGDPRILGRHVIMNNQAYTVVGIAPPEFHGEARGLMAEFWAPLAMGGRIDPDLARYGDPSTSRNNLWLLVVARLKPDVSRRQALTAVNLVKDRLDQAYRTGGRRSPISFHNAGALAGLSDTPVSVLLNILMAVVAVVLLIACANVANLMLARGTARRKEIAVRLAVGAGRLRVVRQLLTESILLALMGAGLGFLLAMVAAGLLGRIRLPINLPIALDFSPDARVLAFTAALGVLSGILSGLVPALRATRPDLLATINANTASGGSLRRFGTRQALVVAQVALSLVLLVSSGLFLRSLQNASSIDIGMRPGNVLTMAVDPRLHNYSAEQTRRYLAQLRERVTALPGVRSTSFVDVVPLSIGGVSYGVTPVGTAAAKPVSVDSFQVGTHYFETMGIPLLRGRDFETRGRDDLVILNETAARRLFPAAEALGREIRDHGRIYQVAGVVKDSKNKTIGEGPRGAIFHALERDPSRRLSGWRGIAVLVKTAGNPAAMVQPVRKEIQALDPNLAVFGIETMRDHVKNALLLPRLSAVLFGVFGNVALVLATAGLYGVVSYSVRRRTREIGIRMALGAGTSQVLRSVTVQGLGLAGAGLAIGLVAAGALTRFTASLLYGVSATDTITFVGVPALLLAVAFTASLIPALRASRVDPSIALRHE